MKAVLVLMLAIVAVSANTGTVFEFSVKDALSRKISLSQYQDKKALLIVNTASKCGFTRQYEGLEQMREKYASRGFEILGFPANDFKQEPGSDEDIQKFVRDQYHVKFPVFKKIKLNGGGAHPLFRFLKEKTPGTPKKVGWNPEAKGNDVDWNFNKFLVINGVPVKRYGTEDEPGAIEADIKKFMDMTGTGASDKTSNTANEVVVVNCETTKGPLKIVVNPSWAPLGARRFLELVDDGFFNDHPLYR
jgi:glutathione peroxidase